MKVKVLWWMLFVSFGALNAYAAYAAGLHGIGDYLRGLGPWGIVATADLLTALLVGIVWMWRDARAKGVAALPYALVTPAREASGCCCISSGMMIRRGRAQAG